LRHPDAAAPHETQAGEDELRSSTSIHNAVAADSDVTTVPPGNQARVVTKDLFEFLAELEVQKALRLQYPVSVVTIVVIEGEPAERTRLVEQMALVIARVLRSTDSVSDHPKVVGLRLLLVDIAVENIERVIRRIVDHVGQTITLRFGVACFPTTARSVSELLLQADSHC
jgi:hypothetical protein